MSKYYSADYLRGFRTGYSSAYSGDWSTCSDAFEYILKNFDYQKQHLLGGYLCENKNLQIHKW